jgi:asparagine synthase (glutamine-hydrolysing)
MKYIERLDTILEEAVRKSVKGIGSFGVLFSGGLDSSLLAQICVDTGASPTLVSVYMEGSRDETVAQDAASFFDLDLVEKVIFEEEVKDYSGRVAEAVVTDDLLDISIGVPFYAGLETASWAGFDSVMCGQGADELFGGYHRYLNLDKKKLEAELKSDVENINIGRDKALAEALGIDLITPYLDEYVIDFGLKIPVDLKIRGSVRKLILRKLAKKRGLPKEIWAREKKAIQYSTGVDKILRRLIKNNEFNF